MGDKAIDLQAIKTFFEPNLGKWHHGAEAPMPAVVKKVADELDGKTMPLTEAVEKIMSATQGKGEISVLSDCIMLYSIPLNSSLADRYPMHAWRVIKYK